MYLNRGLPGALRSKFDRVFLSNLFHGESSKSGNGSSLEQTKELTSALPPVLEQLKIESLLDIPCGDLEWMSRVKLGSIDYIGGDVAPSLISYLKKNYPALKFIEANIVLDPLPQVDLVFCRDLFVHLSTRDVKAAVKNIKRSKSKYLATTTFIDRKANKDLPYFSYGVAWRTINLETAPFNFPKPELVINEKCTEGNGRYGDKAIGIWLVHNIPDY
jgi:hypothetical protein